ncbi:MAG TPA: hypothetical protein VNG53_04455 [Bacteroidia bacterium]|nr:hypothetical protein [Bacteroidia bacterium]
MKKIYLLILPLALYLGSCKNGKTADDSADVIPAGMVQIDLTSRGGLPITIDIPDTAQNKLTITVQSYGETDITVGKNYAISISQGQGDMKLKKADIAGNDVDKFQKFILQDSTTLMYQSQIVSPEFHFYTIVKTGKSAYVVQDLTSDIYPQEAIQTMLTSAKTIKEKAAAPKA